MKYHKSAVDDLVVAIKRAIRLCANLLLGKIRARLTCYEDQATLGRISSRSINDLHTVILAVTFVLMILREKSRWESVIVGCRGTIAGMQSTLR